MNETSKITKCQDCKDKKEVTCADCGFKYTQLVCRHCGGEHKPTNIKFKGIKDGKPVPVGEYCAQINNPYYED